MRILIVGGTAFMGPYVVRRLAGMSHEVTVFHRGRTRTGLPEGVGEILGDRRDMHAHAAALRAARPDVVIDMMLVTEADARGLCETFRGIARRTVAVSSLDVYRAYGILLALEPGPTVPSPFGEDAPLRSGLYPFRNRIPGMDDYDKILVEREVMSHSDLPSTVLRLPMVYGPGDRQHRTFEFLKRMDDRRSGILLSADMARWRGSRGYVEDVAAAIALAATDERAAGRIYNVSEPEALETRRWVEEIGKAAGWQGRIVEAPSERLPAGLRDDMETAQNLQADSSRIRAELGYRESVSLEEGLRRTVAWERANPPPHVDPGAFDYAAEDAALAALKG